ncbi:DUF6464 family protein [Aulosira sp. FACHB-615]|uniref:DUF6464 family protein n=1 Tax=Aulosira sp. FACHB-615 TaxID=2692777 RepID=UPI0016875CA8|nr:DUF6464 family protein [Aulosira sp. FACHB-615]MBD2489019.1 hypothetical protein [Aulosira sp. FACHB-615]
MSQCRIMPKIDFFYVVALSIIVLNAVVMFTQAGIFGVARGTIWMSVWGVLGYWDWQVQRRKRIEQEQELAEAVNRVKPDFVGDRTCKNNAKSPYIRCAINPCGPCKECKYYEQ